MSTLKVAAINNPSAASGGIAISTLGNPTGTGLDLITTQTFSAASNISINNCFTSSYDNYRILITAIGSVDQALTVRLRSAGADLSASSYSWERLSAISTTVAGSINSGTSWLAFMSFNTSPNSGFIDIFSPALSANTQFVSQEYYAGNGMYIAAGAYTVSTAVDGISFFPSTGTTTGTIRIYGYRN